MSISRKTTVFALAILLVVLISASPVSAVVLTKHASDTINDYRCTISITVTGYYHTGETEFFMVTHTMSATLKGVFYWGSVSWGVMGEYRYGELYDETFTLSTTSYLYDDEPYVDIEANTWFYGQIKYNGYPAGGPVDLDCEVLAEPPW